MPAIHLLALVAFAGSSPVQNQQADPDFVPSVANPAYRTEHPLVLFDEAHRNVHRTTNRYRAFADLLRNDGYEVKAVAEPFSAQNLKGAAVLVVANAQGAGGGFAKQSESAFSAEEIQVVRDWVRAGGALMLIADHAPMGSAAEKLSLAFGARMSKGYVEDLSHTLPGPEGDRGGTIVFTRSNGQLGRHPITDGRDGAERINRVYSFTGQAVKGPADAADILPLADSAADRAAKLLPPEPGDPPGRNRIGIGEPVRLKGWSQLIAFPFGKGRVVIGGEAGMYSAQVNVYPDGRRTYFGMNLRAIDNKQLALNTLHWLSRLLPD